MQTSLFDFPHYKIDKPIRLIELFGGVGSQAMALRDIGADFEHYRLVEFDKYACSSYNAIHGTAFEVADIRNIHGPDLGIVDKSSYTYLLTYSFPCTDLSVAGKMQGMSKEDWENGNSTRSGLLWEVERIFKELPKEQLPDVLLMENVPQVHSESNKKDFDSWLEYLTSRGYHNFYKDLNAKDYGIPQNRNRCFCVSILSDDYIEYDFPEPITLEYVMKDFLESNVDEKYYIKNQKADELILKLIENKTLPVTQNKKNDPQFLGNFYGRHDGYDGSVFGTNAPVKTITHSKGGVADILEEKPIPINAENDGPDRQTDRLLRPLTCVSSTLEKSESQIVLKQDTIPESQIYKKTETVLLSKKGTKFEKVTEIASCLMARDYKGLGNYPGNGVIEEI